MKGNTVVEEKDLSIFLPKVTFEPIRICDLVTDQEYQRKLSERHVKQIMENFDLCQIRPVRVSRRDGKNFVIDGQHTMETIAIVSGSNETLVWCMVYDDLEYRREADIFANQQKHVKALTPMEIFKASIEAGSEKHIMIKKIVEQHGLEISPVYRSGAIGAVGALEYIYDHYSVEILSRTLRLLIGAWEGSSISMSAGMLKGTAKLLAVLGTEINDSIFIERLGTVSERQVIRSAHERRGGQMGFAEAMLLVYNRTNRQTPFVDALYKKQPRKKKSKTGSEMPLEEQEVAVDNGGDGVNEDKGS